MGPIHTTSSRIAATLTALLAAAQLSLVVTPDQHASYVGVLIVALAISTAVTALRVDRGNGFEARLAAVGVATASVAGVLVATTIGLPGGGPAPVGVRELVMSVLAVAVVVFLAIDHRHRRSESRWRPPYAL